MISTTPQLMRTIRARANIRERLITLHHEVADYVKAHIRQDFDKEVCARLRSECPRPNLLEKVADTPKVDPTSVTYLKKYDKDLKKGLERA
ncbi:hypothetical protein NDU88_008287 [Pleurodeles waltl]|uniref:Uncharacterized protein n=1 Tax=Pleurodeles waltl TaxID=8319 RepID=A0AAV7N4I8_PLEWA|nr:hypothetical protein NDU88_008287 [Pleurodeles waltl]